MSSIKLMCDVQKEKKYLEFKRDVDCNLCYPMFIVVFEKFKNLFYSIPIYIGTNCVYILHIDLLLGLHYRELTL